MQEYQNYTFDLLNILNVNYWCDDNQKLDEIKKQIKDCDGAFKLVESAVTHEEEKNNEKNVIKTIHDEKQKENTKGNFFKNLKNIFK